MYAFITFQFHSHATDYTTHLILQLMGFKDDAVVGRVYETVIGQFQPGEIVTIPTGKGIAIRFSSSLSID